MSCPGGPQLCRCYLDVKMILLKVAMITELVAIVATRSKQFKVSKIH